MPLHLPSSTGLNALDELGDVDWSVLHQAYGMDADRVRVALELVSTDLQTAFEELWSTICHQGTVYEASAYALPFLVSLAEGDIDAELRSWSVRLASEIIVEGSAVAPNGSHAGALDAGVSVLIAEAARLSEPGLVSIAGRAPEVATLIAAVRATMVDPSDENRDAARDLIDPDD